MWMQLGNKYSPEWNRRPPQLLEQDWPTWEKYRQKIEKNMKEIYYNVALTMYSAPKGITEEKEIRLHLYPIAKRVDAVGWDGEAWHLYEVNKNAKLRSIGQAITYRDLWNKLDEKYKQGTTDLTYIITEFKDTDVEYICEKENIIYATV